MSTSQRPAPAICECGHKKLSHTYHEFHNAGPCLARDCTCPRFMRAVYDEVSPNGEPKGRLSSTTKGSRTDGT